MGGGARTHRLLLATVAMNRQGGPRCETTRAARTRRTRRKITRGRKAPCKRSPIQECSSGKRKESRGACGCQDLFSKPLQALYEGPPRTVGRRQERRAHGVAGGADDREARTRGPFRRPWLYSSTAVSFSWCVVRRVRMVAGHGSNPDDSWTIATLSAPKLTWVRAFPRGRDRPDAALVRRPAARPVRRRWPSPDRNRRRRHHGVGSGHR